MTFIYEAVLRMDQFARGATRFAIAARRPNGDYSGTMLKAWLDSRTPPPPERLARRMDAALAESGDSGTGTIAERLTLAAVAILTQLGHEETRRPEVSTSGDRAPAAALDLLAADALVTYAAEAAAEECQSFAATTGTMIARLAAVRVKDEESD